MSHLQRIVWLASFPKSGNTWTRVFLENYLNRDGGKVDINSLGRFTLGDVNRRLFDEVAGGTFDTDSIDEWFAVRVRVLRRIIESRPGFSFVKTHCRARKVWGHALIPPELTAGAVYILRNPFDVAPSYARHNGEDIDRAIARMTDPNNNVRHDNGICEAIGRWDEHVKSWTEAPGLTRLVLRYEDMVADPEHSFRELLTFLKIPIEFGHLRRALRYASFGELRKQERRMGFRERPERMQTFFAQGRAGAWREQLTPAQVARLRAEFLPLIEKWYPEMLEETKALAEGERAGT